MGGRHFYPHSFAWVATPHWRRIDRQGVALVDDPWVVTKLLGRPIVVQEAVILPFYIVQLGINVGGDLLVTPQFVREEFEPPAPVPVAIQRADTAVFRINQRLAFVQEPRHVVEAGTDKR